MRDIKEQGDNTSTPHFCKTNIMSNTLYKGDCLEVMKLIPDGSVDLILTDPPYGSTACKWDSVIPFEPMWKQLNRIIKPNGAIVLFGSEPFSSALRMSNIKNYKYDWYLNKNWVTGHLNAKKQPMRKVEIAHVFNSKIYYPQGLKPHDKVKNRGVSSKTNNPAGVVNFQKYTNYPNNLIDFIRDKENLHPTQKPVALLEYLIKTYTNENETVLDFTMGSGSTGVACVNTNRKFIGIEMDDKYFEIAVERINKQIKTPPLVVSGFKTMKKEGIENNNGWIKIESEDDLPNMEDNCYCWLMTKENEIVLREWNPHAKGFYGFRQVIFTHYQPMEKPKPPIY